MHKHMEAREALDGVRPGVAPAGSTPAEARSESGPEQAHSTVTRAGLGRPAAGRGAVRPGRAQPRRRERGPWPARPEIAPAALRGAPLERQSCQSVRLSIVREAPLEESSRPAAADVEPARERADARRDAANFHSNGPVAARRPFTLRAPLWAVAVPGRRPAGVRLALRRSAPRPIATAARMRVRRVLAGIAVFVASVAVVVALGLVADAAVQWRGEGEQLSVTVTSETTVWDVAPGAAPLADGAELSAIVEQIVTENSLTTVQLQPGQVLRLPRG
ncbi:hypothetical protein [Pseudonocardia sp. TRM90224]|uniref:hypothetical protein n=1 Tax=Pseudonocardia sp. TRM90224 TaxID=2812678 RepID=UPI001E2C4D85|nr:hypothetical protein [Pseudonocardia sp. TRM90224]